MTPVRERQCMASLFDEGFVSTDLLRDLAGADATPFDVSDGGLQAEMIYARLDAEPAGKEVRHARPGR